MSRKRTIVEGRRFKLYNEWPLEDPVFLELEGVPYETEQNKITVQIPAGLWEFLRTVPCASTELAGLGDRALLARAESIVDEQMAAWKQLTPKQLKTPPLWGVTQEHKPRREQLREQLHLLLEERELQRKLQRQAAAFAKEASPAAERKRSEAHRRYWKKRHKQFAREKVKEQRSGARALVRLERRTARLLSRFASKKTSPARDQAMSTRANIASGTGKRRRKFVSKRIARRTQP